MKKEEKNENNKKITNNRWNYLRKGRQTKKDSNRKE